MVFASILAAVLAAVLLTAHFPSNSTTPTTFLRSSNCSGSSMSSLGTYSLEQLQMHFSSEHAWTYCWLNAAYFMGSPTTAAPKKTVISGFKKTVAAGELVQWTLQVFDVSGSPLRHGGDVLQAAVRGPSLLRPRVFDLRNGTYTVAFVAVDFGVYTARITMRWRSCRAYVFCSEEDIHQPIDEVAALEFTVVGSHDDNDEHSRIKAAAAASSGNHYAAGRWVKADRGNPGGMDARLLGDYVWQPFRGQLAQFPVANLRNRWVYIIGDSLSEHAFTPLVEDVMMPLCGSAASVYQLVNRYNGSQMKEHYKRDAMELFYCADLNLTMTFTFYPDSAPVGGFKTSRFPLVNESTNAIDPARNVTFALPQYLSMFHMAMRRTPGVPHYSTPDAVVFNFGLHYISQFDSPMYGILLRHMLMVVQQEFPPPVKLFWRTTAYTHFEKSKLAEKWGCRTPVRTEAMNDLAGHLVEAMGIETLDFRALSAARADATPDNRHFSLDNVRATYNNILLNRLHDLWART